MKMKRACVIFVGLLTMTFMGVSMATGNSTLTVDPDGIGEFGSHLKKDDKVRFIGPIDAGTDRLLIVVVKGNSEWGKTSKVCHQKKMNTLPTGWEYYECPSVDVVVGGEGHSTTPPTIHDCGIEAKIDASSVSVVEGWLSCGPHPGTLGDHGGAAHAR